MAPTRSMTVPAITPPESWTTCSRAACRAMLKLARSGSASGIESVASVMAILIS
ncbi:hypothetical protein ACFRCI_18875 [Streptomyces sp. NPDC056638]|uniref:hypothetical protein n=1 Tax=Streptomyces sp. NPDC056638 TaxID=3345887 RepID=UPI0036CAFF19